MTNRITPSHFFVLLLCGITCLHTAKYFNNNAPKAEGGGVMPEAALLRMDLDSAKKFPGKILVLYGPATRVDSVAGR